MTENWLFLVWHCGFRISNLFQISRFGFRILPVLLLLAAASVAPAHPVPKNTHDRTVAVHLEQKPGPVTVRVTYTLEVDEVTALTRDLEPYDDIDVFQFRGKALQLYTALAHRLGPDLAYRLRGQANGQRLDFNCIKATAQLKDDKDGTPLGHLRCNFEFTASFAPLTDRDNELIFEDKTYWAEEGKVDLSLVNDAGLQIKSEIVPGAALKQRSPLELEPGDDARLRSLRVVFVMAEGVPTPPAAPPPKRSAAAKTHDEHSLLRLLLHADYGFWLTMLMACVFGAAHALTPGHGKTLVAAYLVGERGTMMHAVVLGVVTTLTHTGVVLLLAAILFCLPGDARESFGQVIQNGLGLAMGLLVVCMGFWLLLQRLSGGADHIHVGGGHHHGNPESGGVRWWGLIVLGVTGGLVPCWDAILLLLVAVQRGELPLALPMVLAFSAGLAAVLVLIGVMVVQVPNFAQSRWGNGRIVRALPILSAVVVTLMGLWLCYEGVQGP